MPKKPALSTNPRAEEARGRKEGAAAAKAERAREEAEAAEWADEGAGKGRAAKKREEEAARKAEAAAKKAEIKRLAEAEEREMAKISKKGAGGGGGGGVAAPKVTAAELAKTREREAEERARAAAAEKQRSSRSVAEDDYGKLVDIENRNRIEALVDAHSVGEAIQQMQIRGGAKAEADAHPEKRAKAAYKAFEEAELKNLRVDRPGLTLNQYKELIWKAWKKSPLNPLNQAASSGS